MKQRREVWERLSKPTKDFVADYLKKNLKLNENQFENFLFPEYEKTLLDGRAMLGMEKSVLRILSAIKNEERIAVFGDYDCDGVPGTALVRDFFEKINYPRVVYYIPHRHTEGYGLNKNAIEILREQGVTLMITIDLGTTNIDEVDFANESGIDVIITDHHLPLETPDGQILPKAYAILNNKQSSCNYANKDLCGSGTVFKLIVEILKALKTINSDSPEKKSSLRADEQSALSLRSDFFSGSQLNFNERFSWKDFEKVRIKIPQSGYEKWLLDLVAIATIADMVPLTYENRTLAIYGLHVLSKTNRGGLHTLFKNSKTDLQKVSETDIAFTIAPRINSASRMAHPRIALAMFSEDLKEGIDAAHELEELNTNRKETTKNITKKIFKILDERVKNSPDQKLPEIVVIGESNWNVGVLGILASKILDRYNVNVFTFGGDESDEKKFKGSCRSRGDIHLVKLMSAVKNKFLHFGGHELAGGFSVSFENLHDLESELNKNIDQARIPNMVEQNKNESIENVIDLDLAHITPDFFDGLKLIGPFGVGNPKPIFKIKNVLDKKVERFGKSKEHLKIKLIGKDNRDRKIETEAIKFFVEENEQENILNLFAEEKLFYEIEAGWNTRNPRLKII